MDRGSAPIRIQRLSTAIASRKTASQPSDKLPDRVYDKAPKRRAAAGNNGCGTKPDDPSAIPMPFERRWRHIGIIHQAHNGSPSLAPQRPEPRHPHGRRECLSNCCRENEQTISALLANPKIDELFRDIQESCLQSSVVPRIKVFIVIACAISVNCLGRCVIEQKRDRINANACCLHIHADFAQPIVQNCPRNEAARCPQISLK